MLYDEASLTAGGRSTSFRTLRGFGKPSEESPQGSNPVGDGV